MDANEAKPDIPGDVDAAANLIRRSRDMAGDWRNDIMPSVRGLLVGLTDALESAEAEAGRLRSDVRRLEGYKAKLTRLSYDRYDDGRLLDGYAEAP